MSNAILEIEIQKISEGTYRINRLKIVGNTAAVSVKKVHLYVKPMGSSGVGIEDDDQGALWATMTATAPTSSVPSPLPTGPLSATPLFNQALAVQMQSTGDVITIGFEGLD